jgi:hypothetical protein
MSVRASSVAVQSQRIRAGVVRVTALLFLALCVSLVPASGAAPRVGILESPTAIAWLRSAGVDCKPISETDLPNSLEEVQVLVLPLDRIRSEAPLRALTAFTARGGKVIAVYWGTVARSEEQSAYPVYSVAPAIGVRVRGWTMTGPAVVRPERLGPSAAGSPDVNHDRGPSSTELTLSRCMLVQVDPEPGAQVLARLVPAAGGEPLVLAVRNGNMLFAAADLFHSGDGSMENRRLFFWLMDQAMPGLAYSRARERAGAAVAAVIRARAQLSTSQSPAADAVRRLLDEADAAASRAKALAAEEQFAASMTAADQSQEITRRALGMLEAH